MLIIKCASCKSKMFRYKKIGKGQVLRCYKERIDRIFQADIANNQLKCSKCGNILGKEVGSTIKMEQNSFTYSGKKD